MPSDIQIFSGAKLWRQAAGIFAGAVLLGLVYNSASPLGVRWRESDGAVSPAPTQPASVRANAAVEKTLTNLAPAPAQENK